MRRILIVAAMTLLVAAAPIERPTPAALRAGLAGDWVGALGYRDYRSDKMFELPVATKIENVPDGVTQIRRARFDEGPRAEAVWITSASIDDPVAGIVVWTSYRKGRPVETMTERVEVTRYEGPVDWTIVYRRTGSDDDKPADIRITETRNGDDLLSVKEVSAVGKNAWAFRNQTKLRLTRN